MNMRNLATMPEEQARAIRIIFCDIDDTITLDGRLPAIAYTALEKLTDAGIDVVPVTGRPAGWCDMIARFWPVRGVIGENGAFYFTYLRDQRKVKRVFWRNDEARRLDREKLEQVKVEILASVKGCGVASDQAYREADLAIDFAEDVGPLPRDQVLAIKALFERQGATAKISSIHVNGWFGDYDKCSMCERYLANEHEMTLDEATTIAAFVGDSPNDEPMFGTFPCSIGVRNLEDFLSELRICPTFICEGRGGIGFAEFADRILRARI